MQNSLPHDRPLCTAHHVSRAQYKEDEDFLLEKYGGGSRLELAGTTGIPLGTIAEQRGHVAFTSTWIRVANTGVPDKQYMNGVEYGCISSSTMFDGISH